MSWEDYMPGGDLYIPEGSGMWQQSGADDWNAIYAPSNTYSGPSYNPAAYQPASYSPPSGGGSYTDAVGSYKANFSSPSFSAPSVGYSPPVGGGGGGSPGARSVALQTPQMISMGKPEDDLYKRYKSLLMNPDFTGDPTYTFLYNQGLQALNRNLAARRMSLSGQSMNDTMAYGSGMASKYMQDLLPQYRAGAQEELNRFMGPAGLLPRYASVNNATIGQSNQMVNNADDRAMYRGMLADPGGGGMDWGAGIGYGGMGSRYTTPPASTASSSYAMTPRPMNYSSGGESSYGVPDLMDEFYG